MAGERKRPADQSVLAGGERPEDIMRDLLERAEVVAEEAAYPVLQHIIRMALQELNEMEGEGRYHALMLREAKAPRSGD